MGYYAENTTKGGISLSEKSTFEVGGIKVTKLVGQNEIDQFVGTLSPEIKADMKDVIMALYEKGLIDIEEKGQVH